MKRGWKCYISCTSRSRSRKTRLVLGGRGDPSFTRKQFGVLGSLPDEDGGYDYLIIDRVSIEKLIADDPEALKLNVYARLLGGFNIQVVD